MARFIDKLDKDETYFTTPKGRAQYPYLTPGDPDTQFDDQGKYKVNLVVDGPAAQEFKEAIDSLAQRFGRFLAENEDSFDPGSESVRRPYEENDDGSTAFKIKQNAVRGSGDDEYEWEPKLFDASGTPCPDVDIGGGSVLRVAGSFYPYYINGPVGAGISLKMSAVQVIELEEYDLDAETFGFGEEDGFSASDVDTSSDDGEEEFSSDESAEDGEDFDF